jgi:hypothetical protein
MEHPQIPCSPPYKIFFFFNETEKIIYIYIYIYEVTPWRNSKSKFYKVWLIVMRVLDCYSTNKNTKILLIHSCSQAAIYFNILSKQKNTFEIHMSKD